MLVTFTFHFSHSAVFLDRGCNEPSDVVPDVFKRLKSEIQAMQMFEPFVSSLAADTAEVDVSVLALKYSFECSISVANCNHKFIGAKLWVLKLWIETRFYRQMSEKL